MNTDIYFFIITVLLFVITALLFNNYLIDKKSNILSMTISIIAVMTISIIAVMAILIICLCIFNPRGV